MHEDTVIVAVSGAEISRGINHAGPQAWKLDKVPEGLRMDILEMARDSGFAVLLDGRIGHDEYTSVSGTKEALQRFADAVRLSVLQENNRSNRFRPAGTGWGLSSGNALTNSTRYLQ